jgi:RNA-directed DNA polymerase
LLANLYLHLLDRIWDRRRLDEHLGARLVRYCDELRLRRSWKSGKSYPHVQPSRKSRRRIGDKLTWLTRREHTPVPMEVLVEEVNASLRGWVDYFHYGNCSRVLAAVKAHAEKRLHIQLHRRHRVKSWGTAFAKYPAKALYGVYGLYQVPTTAGWTRAHA